MATDVIKLDYGLADDMIKTFQQGMEALQDSGKEMQGVATMLQEGALLGRGGEAFTDAIQSKLCPAISKLSDKFNELAQDVQAAVDAMKEADQTSRGMF